ncbi:tannase/feruloyl esterase family alpha/beta hydrolase [Sphingobium sufflavum]|uniref:tannase/feruloyl esterase family alpha/beta hydrolase n=1 Tax=Sphingobium sufflavum TaxID=1129547 RepID=UPI001F3515DE|nr:tannase/feruloyl esterase family alpha/beta hydrolase [Sphingobium sufflavum]MCE7796497.1 tannase/feruloyl esterase family alpha/beta hydrolase [Sphingobium sufflavum]
MTIMSRLSVIASAALMAGTAMTAAAAEPAVAPGEAAGVMPPQACAGLVGLTLPNVTIASAQVHPANVPVPGAAMLNFIGLGPEASPVSGLPAFCRVLGSIHPTADSDIRFEVWLPIAGWDGRFTGGYGGGLAGYMNYMDLSAGIRAGQAVAVTDTGHRHTESSGVWAKGHPEKVRDYAWRGVHETTVVAKQVIKAYYGKAPTYSYFIGCSNGGRQALMEASRFPEDYDGVIAGAPAARITVSMMSMISAGQAQKAPGAPIRADQLRLLQGEVLAQCDGRDGLKDGLVIDPRLCRFDASTIACGTSTSAQCFSKAQLLTLERIQAGRRSSTGQLLAYGFPVTGAEVGYPMPGTGWDGGVITGFIPAGGDAAPIAMRPLAESFLADLAPSPIATMQTFDFDRDPARLAVLSDELDAKPDLGRFFARGGKVILYHGWADQLLPAQGTIDFHRDILRQSGPKAAGQTRFFLAPGMQHCAGGPGPNSFGQGGAALRDATPDRSLAAALTAWVEKGRSPDSVIAGWNGGSMAPTAVQAKPKEWLLCALPKQAVLRPGANPDVAASYECRAPARR